MINPEDPKWTAYVLGELNDRERTRARIDCESTSSDCRRCGTPAACEADPSMGSRGWRHCRRLFGCCHAIDTINVAIATGGKL